MARVHAAVARALEQASARAVTGQPPSVCIGLSGGMDSIVLLHALHALAADGRLRLSAIHVHHGLSPHADRWATFCRAACRRLRVPLSVRKVQVDRQAGLGIEAAARLQRHRVFASLRVDWIALAHHRDDQAETVLLQLLRGAGLRGLSAMPRQSAAPPFLLRPLLDLPRDLLAAFAHTQALEWIDDESNADIRFDRNFIRHEVLPLLDRRFPSARAGLARSARLLAQSARLVEAIAAEDLRAALDDRTPAGVSVPRLSALGEARACEALRAWLRRQGVDMPSERRLSEALRQAMDAGPERAVEVGFGPVALRRYRDRLYLVTVRSAAPCPSVPAASRPADRTAQGAVEWNRRGRMALPVLGGVLLSEPAVGAGIARSLLGGGVLTVGARALEGGPAPRILIGEPPMRRTLKNLWQASAVPPWQRDTWPLLRLGGELACIPGIAVAAPFAARAGEPGRVFRWMPDP